MITRRDLVVAVIAVAATASLVAARQEKTVLPSSVFDWSAVPATRTNVGFVRQFFRTPTATLDELELHVTSLNPGQTSHAPHQHLNEELIIIKEGTVEVFGNGVWTRTGAGSVVFNASNQLHAIRNAGDGLATYHVINWKSR